MPYPHAFSQVKVGELFESCSNLYRKRSTRTAEIVASRTYNKEEGWRIHREYAGAWGYFSQSERVNAEYYWWKAMGAFDQALTP